MTTHATPGKIYPLPNITPGPPKPGEFCAQCTQIVPETCGNCSQPITVQPVTAGNPVAYPVVAQPLATKPVPYRSPNGQWKVGVGSCHNCCFTCCCSYLTAKRICEAIYIDKPEDQCLMGTLACLASCVFLGPCLTVWQRMKIREQHAIDGTILGDVVLTAMLWPCVVCQLDREILH